MTAASLTRGPNEAVTPVDPIRNRNLIWLAITRSADLRAGKANLAAAWDVAVAQMAGAEQAGDLADAARWEAEADALFVQITGQQPDGPTSSTPISTRPTTAR